MINIVCCSIALLSWVLLIISFHIDRSRYRNCYLLFGALVFSAVALTCFAGDNQKQVIIFLADLLFIVLLIVPVFLICNGILMIRREGRGLSNLLSLFFGLIIGAGEVASFFWVVVPGLLRYYSKFGDLMYRISVFSAFFSVSVIYFSISFVMFMIYCIFLQIIPRKRDFDYIIIHGAGLLDGNRISKLLADRLDKAIEVYSKDPTPPILIPSGGKGSDEKFAEAEAMERYLLDKGIPADKIIKEDKSATTFENLQFSKAIIDAQEGNKYTVLVTSNYHVYRALRYCRKIGFKCVGVGSRVALYYWPSALIREFIAVHSEKKHLIILLVGWVISLLPLILIYLVR